MIGPKQRSDASGGLVVIAERKGGKLKIWTPSQRDAGTYHTSELYNTVLTNLTECWIHLLKSYSKPYLSPCREMKKLKQISCVPSKQATANPGPGGRGPSFTRLKGTLENLWPWPVTTPWDWRGSNAAMAAGPLANDLLPPFSILLQIYTDHRRCTDSHTHTHTRFLSPNMHAHSRKHGGQRMPRQFSKCTHSFFI